MQIYSRVFYDKLDVLNLLLYNQILFDFGMMIIEEELFL
jgi:hypothetical protein